MIELTFLFKSLVGLAIAVITGFIRRLYAQQDKQNEALRQLGNEQIRSDERFSAHKAHTQERLDETAKRLERIEGKLDSLPREIAVQIQREADRGQAQ